MNTMKKLLCIVLAALSVFALTACAQEEASPTAYESAVKTAAVITCGEEVLNVSYVYDQDGLLIKEVYTNADGAEFSSYYIYNDAGLCTSEVHNNPDGSKDKYRHTITKEGVLTKTVHTEPTNSKNTFVYTYAEDGKCTGYTLTYASKEVQEATYTYNDLGAIARIDCTGANASVTAYEYDKYGNVIKETVTAGDTETVTTYEYTYQQ